MNPFSTLLFSDLPSCTPLMDSFSVLLPNEPIDRACQLPEDMSPGKHGGDLQVLEYYRKHGFWRKLADLARDKIRILSIAMSSSNPVSGVPVEQWVDLRLESLLKLKYYDALVQELNQVVDIYDKLMSRSLPRRLQLMQALLPALIVSDRDLTVVKLKNLADIFQAEDNDMVLECYEWMASFLVAQKCEPVGIQLYESLKAQFNHESVYCILGKLYLQINEKSKAAEIFDEFESLFPPSGLNLLHILINRSLLAIYNCQYDESLQYIEQLLAIQQDHMEAHNQFALVKLYMGQPMEALSILEQTVADYPAQAAQHTSLLSNLFQLYELVMDKPFNYKVATLKALLPYLGDDFNASTLIAK